jgi:hypothetical protein
VIPNAAIASTRSAARHAIAWATKVRLRDRTSLRLRRAARKTAHKHSRSERGSCGELVAYTVETKGGESFLGIIAGENPLALS